MKIKDWVRIISSLGDDNAIIGDSRRHKGQVYFDLVVTKDIGKPDFYDLTPEMESE